MESTTRSVVGLMSGTSLDGVDAAYCRVRVPASRDPLAYDVEVVEAVTRSYPDALAARLRALCAGGDVAETCRLNAALGQRFAAAVERVVDEAGRSLADVDLVASHGQTVHHLPDPVAVPGCEAPVRSTLQIGDADVIAARTGLPTVADVRAADVAAGGQGAPLTPILDLCALADDTEQRIAQNVGGIGNCTVLPPGAGRDDVRAFDTGPGNMVVDGVVRRLTDGAETFDEDGRRAAAGTVDDGLVDACLDAPYFRRGPPKTTGREAFGEEYVDSFVARGRERGCDDADLVASATMLTARSIADAYDRFVPEAPDRVVVSGGGAANPTLLAMLREELACSVDTSDAHGVDPDAKEAALMALLGQYNVDGAAGNVPTATGADRPVVLGKRAGFDRREPEQ